MANTIKIKQSSTASNVPASGELTTGELAINVTDRKLYSKDATTVFEIAPEYSHPTHPGDDFSVDTTALTGATVVSDIDINVTTDTLGHVTDANGVVSTREFGFNDLAAKTSGTGDYLTSGDIGSGENSGGVAMTINDGYGNANLTFNHRSGTPDNTSASQSAGRIECTTDNNTASFSFELGNSTVQDTPVALTQVMEMNTTRIQSEINHDFLAGIDVTGNITVTGTVDSVDIAAFEAAAAKTADNETITGAWTFDGVVTTADYGTGGRVKDGTDVSRPMGFNVMPIYEIDVDDTFDLAHNGMMWHRDAGTAVNFTCNSDTTIPVGATYVVFNEGTDSIEITAGTASVLWIQAGAAPVSGSVTVERGGIVTVYKYADAEFWVWGAKEGGAASPSLVSLTDTTITSPTDAALLLYDTGTSTWRDAAMSGDATISDTGVVTVANDSHTHTTATITGLSGTNTGDNPGVTAVNNGNGMNFTNITGTGTVTLGTPGSITDTSTNSVSTSSHTHAVSHTGTGSFVMASQPTFTGKPQSAGLSTSWGTTSGINTGGYNTTMGTSSSATWLLSGTSSGTFRGGFQLLDSGTTFRLYANANYINFSGSAISINGGSALTSNTGTVTAVNNGNGMNFTNISTSGTVTLGTPGSITDTSTNSVSTSSHTHAVSHTGTGSFAMQASPTFTTKITSDKVFLNETSAATTDVAGDGQIWVKNNVPNDLWFTNDAGVDYPVGYAVYRKSSINVIDNINQTLNMTTDSVADAMVGGAWVKTNTTAYTLTLEPSTDTEFPVGGQIAIWNRGASGNMTVSEGSGTTLYVLDGSTSTDAAGSATVGPGGYATLIRESTTIYLLMGAGVTA